MPEFHHPYNFIPVKGKVNDKKTETVEYAEIKAGKTGIRHDLWQSGRHSGRIIAQIHLMTPTVVGGMHTPAETPEGSNTVQVFKRDANTAIPANSLRGVIGSLAETLSQSSLRVLEKRQYSVRKSVGEGLSAIGMLKKGKEGNTLELLPLTLPITQTRGRDYKITALWQQAFSSETKTTFKNCLPAYLNAYTPINNQPHLIQNSFLGLNPDLECFQAKKPVFYYARLHNELDYIILNDGISLDNKCIKSKNTQGLSFLLGQKIYQNEKGIDDLLTKEEYEKLLPKTQELYTKGFLHILGIQGREAEIPSTKKHEFFIPLHTKNRLVIPQKVLDDFKTLLDQRHDEDENLPFLPKGYKNWQPESGQLVFFDVCRNLQGQIEVSEISFSAIWRKLLKGNSHEFFGNIDADLLPWNPQRHHLTPAECLFGVVEDGKGEGEKHARALASRVRFSDAQATKAVTCDAPVTLKILSSPKLPSPALYFHQRLKPQGTFIKKTDLTLDNHEPNGRKVYLHHQANAIWETQKPTESLKQKMRCQPMSKGQDFYFHIDFDNLSTDELNLLIRSVQPVPDFQHRLGLGKALGLGSVEMKVMGIFLIDRAQRYSVEGFYETTRYHRALKGTVKHHSEAWKALYPTEYAMLENATDLSASEFYAEGKLIDKKTLGLLATVGNPAHLKKGVAVKPPLTTQQNDVEHETFQWFVNNEKSKEPQALKGIEEGKPLPVLKTN